MRPCTTLKLIEAVRIQTDLDPWLSLGALAAYSGMGVRKIRDLLTRPLNPLPHYKLDHKILVRRSHFDRWMEGFRHTPDIDRIVAEALADLRK